MVYRRLGLFLLPHKLRMGLVVSVIDELRLAELRIDDVSIDGVGVRGARTADADETSIALVQGRQNHLYQDQLHPTW
eukprot:745997-Hanusia_phi.AAC.1